MKAAVLYGAHTPFVVEELELMAPRAGEVVLRGLTVDGTERIITADAFEARAMLHELDHLDGMLFLDRVVSHDAVFPRKVYR